METEINIDDDARVNEILASWELAERYTRQTAKDLAMIIGVDDLDNGRLRKWVVDNTNIRIRELKAAVAEKIHKAGVVAELGAYPQTPMEFVKLYFAKHKVEIDYSGAIKKNTPKFVLDHKGEKMPVTEEDMVKLPGLRDEMYFQFEQGLRVDELKRDIRVVKATLGLMKIGRDDIDDAVNTIYQQIRDGRRMAIFNEIGHASSLMPEEKAAAAALWEEIARNCFDVSETSVAFVVAVIQAFFWQVKRKMRGLAVRDHLMPVIIGRQGSGKSTFMHQMLAPVRELTVETNFAQMVDARSMDIWRNFVMVFDEMGYASKADVDSIKHRITAKTLSFRPMRENSSVNVDQCATMIGASNKVLGQLFADATGGRRFISLMFGDAPDHAFVNSIDWKLLWRSVDIYGDHPMAPHKDMLAEVQADEAALGRVETWLVDFNPLVDADAGGERFNQQISKRTNRIPAQSLYDIFRAYEDRNFPGSLKTTKTAWEHEMKRLETQGSKNMVFTKGPRATAGMTYEYVGQKPIFADEIALRRVV